MSGFIKELLLSSYIQSNLGRIFLYTLINISTDRLKWHPMPDQKQEFTLRHNVQRHLGQSEDWIFWALLVTRTCNVWLNVLSRQLSGIRHRFKYCRYASYKSRIITNADIRYTGKCQGSINWTCKKHSGTFGMWNVHASLVSAF